MTTRATEASTSEADLRRQLTIAGQPSSVLWSVSTIRPQNPDSFPPGPSDSVLTAVLTYPSPEDVAAIVGTDPTEPVDFAVPDWAPPELKPGSTAQLTVHYGVEDFMNATVMTVPDAPQVIVLVRPNS